MGEEKNCTVLKPVWILSFLALSLMGGCEDSKPKFTEEELSQIPLAQRTGLPECSGGFVLAVGEETITSEEVIAALMEHLGPFARSSDFEQFKAQAGPQIEQVLITRISNILLYQKAKSSAGEQVNEALEKAAEAEVRKFVAGFGGDYARAEEALKQRGMNWRSFKEYQKKMILSQSYVSSQLPDYGPVTYSELLNYYNVMKDELFATPAMLKFQLIDIEVAKLEVTEPNQTRDQQAKTLADELLERLRTGEDFGALAEQYSHGHRRAFGGLWKPVQPESLAEPYDVLAARAEKMQPGQLAGPIEAGGHIFIMKLLEKKQVTSQPFEQVQKEVEARIIFDRRKKAVDELGAKLVRQAAVADKDEFVDFCLREIYRISNE